MSMDQRGGSFGISFIYRNRIEPFKILVQSVVAEISAVARDTPRTA